MTLGAPIQEIRKGSWSMVGVGITVLEDNQLFRMLEGQAQGGGIHDAENCRVHADAQGQRNHRNHGEARVLAKLAQCITEILK
jgi:hypothetical protein